MRNRLEECGKDVSCFKIDILETSNLKSEILLITFAYDLYVELSSTGKVEISGLILSTFLIIRYRALLPIKRYRNYHMF